MRFSVLILFYDCDQFILRAIENCAPNIEKIYIAYSPLPWSYNPEAREKFKNPSDPSILQQSEHLDKIELIEGDWLTEEDQRNEVLDRAKAEGFDYLIIQDADEFFRAEDYQANLRQIEANPDYAYYRTPWYQFWKSTDYVLRCRYSYCYRKKKVEVKLEDTLLSFSMAFALNLHKDIRFEHCRRPTQLDDYLILDGICFHLSYVLSDAQVERKIQTYGHTGQIRHATWLRRKWYGWRPSSRCLHPLSPAVWVCAERFRESLPDELVDLSAPMHLEKPLSVNERFFELIRDQFELATDWLRRAKASVKLL